MGELVNILFLLGIGGFIAVIGLLLMTDDDRPHRVVDTKTLNINNGTLVTVETYADGTSRVVSCREVVFFGTAATVANGRLAKHWQEMADAGLLN